MANTTHLASDAVNGAVAPSVAKNRALGFLIVCLVPALFWTGMLMLGGWAFGLDISARVLFWSLLAIAAFLAVVFSALTFAGEPR